MSPLVRSTDFCRAYGLELPILLAPMAGACPVDLSAAVSGAGGMGACGALLMGPEEITNWANAHRAASNGAFQINLWIPESAPERNLEAEAEMRAFLGAWGPEVKSDAGDAALIDFDSQCAAILTAGPAIVSSIMGIYPEDFVQKMKTRGIRWFATVTTVAEALEAEAAGADVIVAQGAEAGGHRGAFVNMKAEAQGVGLFALLPAVVDKVSVPVVATGGIADARGIAAALALGASAVQIGTGFLRCPEAGIAPAWAEALAQALPEDTVATRGFSGRLGRSLRTGYTEALDAPGAPKPAPYPVQRGLTAAMRGAAAKADDLKGMQAWAGQSARLACAEPAGALTRRLWQEAQGLLGGL